MCHSAEDHDQRARPANTTAGRCAGRARGGGGRSGAVAAGDASAGPAHRGVERRRRQRASRRERCIIVSAQESGSRPPCVLLDTEPVGPGHQRPEQQLVVQQDHDEHGRRSPSRWRAGCPARWRARCRSRCRAARCVVWPTLIDFGGDHEEPAAGHRHHHVPDQRRHARTALRAARSASRPSGGRSRPPRCSSSGTVRSDW